MQEEKVTESVKLMAGLEQPEKIIHIDRKSAKCVTRRSTVRRDDMEAT